MGARLAFLAATAFLSLQYAMAGDAEPKSLAPEIQRGLELRAKYGIPIPAGTPMIYLHAIAVHHSSEEYMAVASRDSAGRWIVSWAGEEGSGILQVTPHLIPEKVRALSGDEGRALDAVLATPELYEEHDPDLRNEFPGVGAWFLVIEIVTPNGHLTINWFGRLLGSAGKVADLVIGKAD